MSSWMNAWLSMACRNDASTCSKHWSLGACGRANRTNANKRKHKTASCTPVQQHLQRALELLGRRVALRETLARALVQRHAQHDCPAVVLGQRDHLAVLVGEFEAGAGR